MESVFLEELALAGILDEISNAENGEAIGRFVRSAGGIGKGHETQKSVLFVVYQTGQEGPQNGFRLALVKTGVTAEFAVQQLKGNVARDAAESVVVKQN
ncbi:MAG: hypothetical protein Q9176_008076 [Flavoplaca citrina]